MISTNNTKIGNFYESYKNACAPNPVLDLNYRTTYNYLEDFLLQVVSFLQSSVNNNSNIIYVKIACESIVTNPYSVIVFTENNINPTIDFSIHRLPKRYHLLHKSTLSARFSAKIGLRHISTTSHTTVHHWHSAWCTMLY